MQAIGIDIGTTRIKSVLLDRDGMVRHSASSITARPSRSLEFSEIDPATVYGNVISALRNALRRSVAEEIVISVSAMSPILILVDGYGNPIRPGIMYNDLRASKEVMYLNREVSEKKLLAINGSIANSEQWAPKLLWLRRNSPATLKRAKCFFDLTTYLVYKLTDEIIIDHTVAGSTGFFDYRKRDWSKAMLDFLHLDEDSLPELRNSYGIAGPLMSKVRNSLGLSGQTKVWVTNGCLDSSATALSLGMTRSGQTSIEIGTTDVIFVSTECPKPSRRLFLTLSPIENLYYVGGSTAASGLFIEQLLKLTTPEPNMSKAANLAAKSKPGSNGLVMLPFIAGERTPIFDPYARGVIFGLSLKHRREDLIRAGFESVAYSFLHHLRILREMGFDVNMARVAGGGTRNVTLMRILADVLGIRLKCYPERSAALGDAILAFKSRGLDHHWMTHTLSASSMEYKPIRSNTQLYEFPFSIYIDLYSKLKDNFKKMGLHATRKG